MSLDDPLHSLVGRTADRGRSPVSAHISVGGNHVHPFLRVLNGSPCVVLGDLVGTATVTTQGLHRRLRHDAKGGDFYLATNGDLDPATSGDLFMATDKCSRCGKKSTYGRYSVCSDCLVKQGGRACSACGRLFRPDASTGRKAKCATCRRGRKTPESAFVVTQAGSPGLGKRA